MARSIAAGGGEGRRAKGEFTSPELDFIGAPAGRKPRGEVSRMLTINLNEVEEELHIQ